MADSSDLRLSKIPLNHGGGQLPAEPLLDPVVARDRRPPVRR